MAAVTAPPRVRFDPDVFISYRRTDKEFVEKFVDALKQRGPAVWWDSEIEAGDDWRESIVDNLQESEYLVIVFSDDCNSSKQLVKELAVADRLNKLVIPLKIDESEPRGSYLYELAYRNWIDANPDPIDKVDAVAARVVERLRDAGWSPPPDEAHHAPTASMPPTLAPPPAPKTAAPPQAAPDRPASESTALRPPSSSLPPPTARTAAAFVQPSAPAQPTVRAESISASRFDLREIFPFHWADFIVPVLFGVLGLFSVSDGAVVGLGDALFGFAMGLALVGLVVFPIRYYRRRANPFRVARNLVISNITFAVLFAIGGSLAPEDLVEEGETVNEARLYFTLGSFTIALMIAAASFVIFFALSRSRARRELHAHMEPV